MPKTKATRGLSVCDMRNIIRLVRDTLKGIRPKLVDISRRYDEQMESNKIDTSGEK